VDVTFPADKRAAIIERLRNSLPEDIGGVKVSRLDTYDDGYRFHLSDGAWLLIRFSGTEPLLRIYAECESKQRTQELLDTGKKLAGL